MHKLKSKKLAYAARWVICFALCFFLTGCGGRWGDDSYSNDIYSAQLVQRDDENQETALTEDTKEQPEEEIENGGADSKTDGNAKSQKKEKDESNKSSSSERSKSKAEDSKDEKDSSSKDADSDSTKRSSAQPGKKYTTISDGTDTHQDSYQTDPVPDGQPNPVEPQEVTVDEKVAGTCSLVIECSTILDNMDSLKKGKESIVPKDGIIYQSDEVRFYEGESVADVLKRETRENSIHLEFSKTPGFNSDYIEGIGNIYVLDCGALSGWSYCVNSWFPNYGCSRYVVTQGDGIEWHYTCNMGKDISAGTGIR